MSVSPVPQYCPTPRELDDLELLVSGALAPIVAFNEPGSPVTLTLPAELAAADEVELVDPEGLPLALVEVRAEADPLVEVRAEADPLVEVRAERASKPPVYEVTPLTTTQFGPFREHYLTPAQAREQFAGRTFVPVTDALTEEQIAQLGSVGPVVLMPLVGTGTPDSLPSR